CFPARCADRAVAERSGLETAPAARTGADRAAHLRHRIAALGHHGRAPAADRRSGASGFGDVAVRDAAAASAARDLGTESDLPAVTSRLRQASCRAPGIHGRAPYFGRPSRGML